MAKWRSSVDPAKGVYTRQRSEMAPEVQRFIWKACALRDAPGVLICGVSCGSANYNCLWKRMRSGDRPGLQNRRAASFGVAGGFDSHSLPPFVSMTRKGMKVQRIHRCGYAFDNSLDRGHNVPNISRFLHSSGSGDTSGRGVGAFVRFCEAVAVCSFLALCSVSGGHLSRPSRRLLRQRWQRL